MREATMEFSYTLRQVAQSVWPGLRELLNAKTDKQQSIFDARISYRLAKLAKPFQEAVKELDEQKAALGKKHGIDPAKKDEDQTAKIAAAQKELDALLDEKETFDVKPVELPEEAPICGGVLLDLDGLVTIHTEPVEPVKPTLAK
jgi:glycine/D-amino acid oxidase-like deaminating enzyme